MQNGIRSVIPAPCEEPAPALIHSPNGPASCHPDTRVRAPENVCMPSIPSQSSSTMVASVPPMTYPPPPTAFYAPAPWFMHPYPYAPPPHIIPSYPQFPLASSVVGVNEPSRPVPSNTMYQVWTSYFISSLWITDFCSQSPITLYTLCHCPQSLQLGSNIVNWQA